MKAIQCKVCGYVALNGKAPEHCPVCFAPKTAFEEKDALKTAKDEPQLGEKHVPVITVVKKCGLIPDGCVDVHAKIGSVTHPMEEKHYITKIDFYLDDEFLSRVILTPVKLNPAAGLHLKVSSGKVAVIEHCSLHGSWFAEQGI